jgi:probable HAF family extracellular repeat protein
MKSRFSTIPTAIALFAALAIPAGYAAQNKQHQNNAKHHHYKLFDLGTLGGPNSGVPTVFYEINGTAGAQAISNQGIVTDSADTSITDPLCFFDDCYYPHAIQWQDGTLTDLGALPGSQWSAPTWISNNGLIAGISENGVNDPITGAPEGRAVLWQGGQITDLGTLAGGYESGTSAVNSQGQVVGLTTNGTSDPYSYWYYQIDGVGSGTQGRAFLWDQHDGMQDLGTLGGPDAWAGQINDAGQVAGISYTSSTANSNNATCAPNSPTQDPFFWDKNTGMIDVGTFGGTCGITNAINNRGQVAGQSYLAGNTVAHAFVWSKKGHPQLTDLGTLGGDNASALWIDDAGDVVGYADVYNPGGCGGLTCVHHAVLWGKHGITDLGTIGTDPCSRALSVNSADQVVGFTAAVCGGNPTHGFLWEKGGPAVDLNSLVNNADMTLTTPIYLNDRGEIAGNGVLSNGDTHAFLLIPCDEHHPGVESCDYSLVNVNPSSSAHAGSRKASAITPSVAPRLDKIRSDIPAVNPKRPVDQRLTSGSPRQKVNRSQPHMRSEPHVSCSFACLASHPKRSTEVNVARDQYSFAHTP